MGVHGRRHGLGGCLSWLRRGMEGYQWPLAFCIRIGRCCALFLWIRLACRLAMGLGMDMALGLV